MGKITSQKLKVRITKAMRNQFNLSGNKLSTTNKALNTPEFWIGYRNALEELLNEVEEQHSLKIKEQG